MFVRNKGPVEDSKLEDAEKDGVGRGGKLSIGTTPVAEIQAHGVVPKSAFELWLARGTVDDSSTIRNPWVISSDVFHSDSAAFVVLAMFSVKIGRQSYLHHQGSSSWSVFRRPSSVFRATFPGNESLLELN